MELKQMLDVIEMAMDHIESDVRKLKLPNNASRAYQRATLASLAEAQQQMRNVGESADFMEKEKAG